MAARSFPPMRGRVKLVAGAMAAAFVLAGPLPARAQDRPQWLILPSSAGEVPGGWVDLPRGLAVRLRAADAAVYDPEEARRLFERRESAVAAPIERAELEELEQRIERAMVLVATGQRRGALREMNDGMVLLRRASESINREATVARRALDGCLITARALLELRQREPARDRARECLRLFPGVEPDGAVNPPWVLALLTEVQAELEAAPRGTLRVLAERAGCGVYLQGLRVGTTPFERDDFTPGEQRIQVACTPDRPGRVHRIVLGAQPTTVDIDTRFDEVVRTTGMLALRYPTAEEENRRRLADARTVARVLGATEVLLATPVRGLVRLDRVRVEDLAVLASVFLGLHGAVPDRLEVQLGAAALGRGESADVSRAMTEPASRWQPPAEGGATPARHALPAGPETATRARAAPLRGATPAPAESAESRVTGRHIGGGALVVTGLASLGLGWYLYATTGENQNDWDVGTGTLGAGLAALGVAVLKGREWGTPVLSLAGLAVGVTITGFSIGAFALHGECEREDPAGACLATYDSQNLGILLLDTALPFLAFPLTQVVQKLTGPEEPMTVTASVSDRQTMFHLRGAF
jgi:hypothetical protein